MIDGGFGSSNNHCNLFSGKVFFFKVSVFTGKE